MCPFTYWLYVLFVNSSTEGGGRNCSALLGKTGERLVVIDTWYIINKQGGRGRPDDTLLLYVGAFQTRPPGCALGNVHFSCSKNC